MDFSLHYVLLANEVLPSKAFPIIVPQILMLGD